MCNAIVTYGGKRLVPAPFITIERVFQKAQNGLTLGTAYNINLNGTLVARKGSPGASGSVGANWTDDWWTGAGYPTDSNTIGYDVIQYKQKKLLDAFATEGLKLEVLPCEGQPGFSFYPKINTVSLQEGIQVEQSKYTISMEADRIYGFSTGDYTSPYISQAEETWNLEFNDKAAHTGALHTFLLTHTVNAVGKTVYYDGGVTTAWQEAKAFVLPRLGLDNYFAASTGVMNLPAQTAYNHVRSENTDELGGSYSVTESWVLSSGGGVFEDFTVSSRISATDGLINVSIEGSIEGMETINYGTTSGSFSVATSKYTRASNYFANISGSLYNRCTTYGELQGKTLNLVPLNTLIGKNPTAGTITYNYEYDNRPSYYATGVLSEIISFNYQNAADVFTRVPIIGRAAGPILQDMNTVTETTKEISIEAIFNPSNDYSGMNRPTAYNTLITLSRPSADTIFTESDVESWTPTNGRYSRQVRWVWQDCP